MKQNIKAVNIKVNGQQIKLNSFVKQMFGNTIFGMISSLQLDHPPNSIEIRIEVESSGNED